MNNFPNKSEIVEFIRDADPHQCQFARKTLIPNCKGILDEERAALHQLVDDRFAALNFAAATTGRGRSLLTISKSLHTSEETTTGTKNDGPN